jgi:transcriptional regulator with XRE-family HTH domain
MLNIGAKIKELRKARKMTLADVAGDRITKGMLSLIENGKAQPSMESLQHIAKQLNIDVAELMQTGDSEEIRELYKQAEQLRVEINQEYVKGKYEILQQQLHDLIEPFVVDGRLKGQTFEEVRLYEMYLGMRNRLNIDKSFEPFFEVVPMYEQVHAYSKILGVFSRLASFKFEERKYEEALAFLIEAETYLDRYGDLIGDLERLDLYYNIMVMYAAVNDYEKAEQYFEQALKIANEKKILYRFNDFYRFMFLSHCSNENSEKAVYYLKKIRLLTEVFEDPIEMLVEQILTLFYINYIEKDYEKTIATTFEQPKLLPEVYEEISHFLKGEYAYAYWQLNRIDEALEQLLNFKIPYGNQHPLDLMRFYRGFAIRALCYYEKGDYENAKRDILYAVDGVKVFKELMLMDKQFIMKAYETIMNK